MHRDTLGVSAGRRPADDLTAALSRVGSGASALGGVLSAGYGLGIWYAAMASITAVPLVTARIVATEGASAVIRSASVARAIISRKGPPTMNVGTAELFTCSVTDANGNPCAPGSVVAEMSLPNGATVPLSPVLNPTLGSYTAQFIPTLAGVHTIRFNGTAPYVFQQDQQYICTGPAF